MYVLRRLLASIPILIGTSIIAFMLGIIAPGDPAAEALSMGGVQDPTAEEVQMMRERLGLDQPLVVQYTRWLGQALKGDLGTSYMTKQSVSQEIIRRLPVTLRSPY